MERMTVKRADGRWAIANNDGASPAEQLEKFPVAIARLAAYEDTGLEPEDVERILDKHGCGITLRSEIKERLDIIRDIPTDKLRAIIQRPNPPLTLEELRGMDGEPVWVEFPKCPEASGWMLVSADRNSVYDGLLGYCDFENSGTTWQAYRRKRSEGTP